MNLIQSIVSFLEFSGFKPPDQTESLSPFYQTYLPSLPIALLDSRGLISHEYTFAYFRIPKAANSTVVASLYHAERSLKVTSLSELQEIKDHYYSCLSSLSWKELTRLQRFYYKFTFVRHPYTRILSSYLDKIVSNEHGRADQIASFLGKPVNSKISLNDFLAYLENGGIDHNAHWARQSDLLSIPLSEFDFVGKTENLDKDLAHVLRQIFREQQPMIISVQAHATNASNLVGEINSAAKARIYRLYESDFENFGYSIDA